MIYDSWYLYTLLLMQKLMNYQAEYQRSSDVSLTICVSLLQSQQDEMSYFISLSLICPYLWRYISKGVAAAIVAAIVQDHIKCVTIKCNYVYVVIIYPLDL